MLFYLESNQICIILGASSGIGAATAVHFASLGYCVALNGRNHDALRQTHEECLKANKELNESNVYTPIQFDFRNITLILLLP